MQTNYSQRLGRKKHAFPVISFCRYSVQSLPFFFLKDQIFQPFCSHVHKKGIPLIHKNLDLVCRSPFSQQYLRTLHFKSSQTTVNQKLLERKCKRSSTRDLYISTLKDMYFPFYKRQPLLFNCFLFSHFVQLRMPLFKHIMARKKVTKFENQKQSGNVFHLPWQHRIEHAFSLKFTIGL